MGLLYQAINLRLDGVGFTIAGIKNIEPDSNYKARREFEFGSLEKSFTA